MLRSCKRYFHRIINKNRCKGETLF